ncbi:lactadherin-like [Oculina patagonica]
MYRVQVHRYVALPSTVFLSLLAISLFHLGQVLGVVDNCFHNPVGVASQFIIPDHWMSASSYYNNDANYQAAYGRLHGSRGDGWCTASSSSNDDWLQVDLGQMLQVCGVATQGDGTHDGLDEWVTDFKLSFSSDGITWTTYKDGHGAQVEFHREGDSDTVDQHKLPVAVSAKYIRFHPTQQHKWNCLRVEVYDSDECLANTHDCHLSATCTNTDGSFTCACNVGYTGDGKSINQSTLLKEGNGKQ